MSKISNRRSARARLQLLTPPARPARPPYLPPRRLPRRPGERREPLSVDLSPALAAAAAARGLDLACAAELCLERALIAADLVTLGRRQLYKPLLALVGSATVNRPLPPAKARYLQMLLAARAGALRTDAPGAPIAIDGTDGAGDTVVDVSLRLFPRVLDVAEQLTTSCAEELIEALALEIAAVSDGRTMSEWAAVAALRFSL